MREWRRAITLVWCGGRCRAAIAKGDAYLVITNVDVTLKRCAACAKAMFGEDPPAVIEAPAVPVPAPSLPLSVTRQPDFVTPRQLAKSVQWNDVKSRQTGERE